MNPMPNVRTIAFVSCVKSKAAGSMPARKLFGDSALFRLSYTFAQSLRPDLILLLTTEYGLVQPTDVIGDYDRSPNTMSRSEWRSWGQRVIRDLRQFADLDRDRFVFVTGAKYADALIPHLRNVECPLDGLTQGRRLQFPKTNARIS